MKALNSKKTYWIGGSPCSGKSTIAERLAEKYGLVYYKCDDAYPRHVRNATTQNQPAMSRLSRMSLDEIFSRPVEIQVEETLMCYREEMAMIRDDITALGPEMPIVVEGAALLPEIVSLLLADYSCGIWITPTAEFQVEQYRRRSWVQPLLQECREPEQAFANWMSRDIAFAKYIADDAWHRGLRTLIVNGNASLEDNLKVVELHFQLSEANREINPNV